MLRRILYLFYYLKELEWRKFFNFLDHVSASEKIAKWRLINDLITSSLRYNISPLEYFQFHFYRLSREERASFAGTGFMYEYQLAMNPRSARGILSDKLRFLKVYAPFIRHEYASLSDLETDTAIGGRILENASGKVVLKSSDGQCGRGIEVRACRDFTPETLVKRMRETSNDYVETFVVQHDDLMKLSASGLNTVRIITQIDSQGKVDILAARLRISVNSHVDNLAAGNIAAPIDAQTGIVEGPGVYSDITRDDVEVHPVTRERIVGFKVPFWRETITMAKEAAMANKDNRSIGWDIAITSEGPELIEGNHDWCKLLWQLPVKKGLKRVLETYL